MKHFTVDYCGGFIDVPAAEVSPFAQAILGNYLVGYFDAQTSLGEDLYLVDDFETAGIPEGAEGIEEVEALVTLAKQYEVSYVRLVGRPVCQSQAFSGRQWQEIALVTAILSAHYFDNLHELTGAGEKTIANLFVKWGMAFIDCYGIWPPTWRGTNGETFEQLVKHWGNQCVASFKNEEL